MNTRKLFEKAIIEKSLISNENGYVSLNQENLVDGINIDLFETDLLAGSGNELENKFNALYSSSALTVNSFALIKKFSNFKFLGYTDFVKINFERQFRTGLKGTPPNLDFVLENNKTIIGFESKYLELLKKTKASFEVSYNKTNLSYLKKFWIDLIKKYNHKSSLLDVAQLIKHSIGMINQASNKKLILVYIYWTPINKSEYDEYKIHETELTNFANELKGQNDIEFISLTYDELWNQYDNFPELKDYSKNLRMRYSIEI